MLSPVRNSVLTQIVAKIPASHDAEFNSETGYLRIDGVECHYWISVREMMVRRRIWDKSSSGAMKYRVVVDGKNFPQRNDGTHNYSAIAELLVSKVQKGLRERACYQIETENRILVKNLKNEIGLREYGPVSIRPTPYRDVPFSVKVDLTKALTEERTRDFVQRLDALIREFE